MEEIENLIVDAECISKKWFLVGENQDSFEKEVEILNFFGKFGWKTGSAIKMPAKSDIRTEIYKYYFWRVKQKQKR